MLLVGLTTWPRAMAQTVEALGIGTVALLGGDLTDPENDGNEAAGPFDSSWNWRAITSNNEPGFGGGEFAFNLFDNRVGGGNDKWCCDDATFANPLWVNVEFHQPVSLTHFTATSGDDDPTRDPRDFRVQGSNDGVNYTDIYVRSSDTAPWNQRNQVLKFTLAQPAPPYLHIRWVSLDTSGSLHQLNEVEYFGTVVPLPFTVDNRFNPTGTYVVFDQPVDPATVVPGNFTVAGLDVTSAQLQGDGKTVVLTTAAQTEGHTYALTVQGVLYAGGGAVSPGPITRPWTHGAGVQIHRITHDRWDGIAGTTTDVVTGLSTYPDNPSFSTALPRFEIPPDIANNYGGRLFGLFNPPTTGSYTFYISSDDQSQLFLSTDASPASNVQIAAEPNWNGSRQYVNGSNQASRGNPPANISAPVNLTQGQPVWLELLYKEGDGGDNASATARFPGGAAIVNGSLPLGEEHFAIRYRQGPDGTRFQAYGPVAITQPPSGASVVEGATVTLTAVGDGSPPHRWQWRRNGDVVPGATGPTHSFTVVPGTEGSYTVTLANDFSEAASTPAAINVTFDNTAPTLVSASGTEGRNRVRVQFSEPVDAATATALSNYSLTGPDGPLAVTAAQLLNPSLVELLTAKQPEGALFTLTVNNVTDTALAKNPIAPNSSAEFRAYVFITGGVLHRRWNGVDTLAGLTGLAGFPDLPDVVTLEPLPEYPPNGGNEAGTGYGNLLTFWWTPPETGDYEFFLSADDQAELWLSTDDDPANKKRIAIEPSWNNPRQWISTERRNAAAPENRSTTYQATQWPGGPGPIHLEAGQRYFLEAVHAEGSGGDNVGVNVRRVPTSPARATPTVVADFDPPAFLPDETQFPVAPGSTHLAVTEQPQDATVLEGRTATFRAHVKADSSLAISTLDLTPYLIWQWQCAEPNTENWINVEGATGPTFTTSALTLADDGRKYRVVASLNSNFRLVTSNPATVTVVKDEQPPLVIQAGASSATSLQLTFSEEVDATSAQQANNYQLETLGGTIIPIVGAALADAGDGVTLTLGGPVTFGAQHLLTVNNVQDLFGNFTDNQTVCLVLNLDQTFPDAVLSTGPQVYLSFNKQNWITMENRVSPSGLFGVHFVDGVPAAHAGVPGFDFDGLGLDNYALGLNGNNHVEIQGGPSPVENTTGFTVMLVVKPGPMPEPRGYSLASQEEIFAIEWFNFDPDSGQLDLEIDLKVAGGQTGFLGTTIPADGKPHLIVCVWDGTDLIIHVDGVEKARGPGPNTTVTTSTAIGAYPLQLGRGDSDSRESRFGSGLIDEFAAWGDDLSSDQINSLWGGLNADTSGTPPGITAPSQVTLAAGESFAFTVDLSDSDTALVDVWLNAAGQPADFFPGGLTLEGAGATRTVKGTVAPGAMGPGRIVFDASDGRNFFRSESAVTFTIAEMPPVFTTHPQSQSVARGQGVTLTAQASGFPEPTYQWFHNGEPIEGATGPTLVLAAVHAGNAGTYQCLASSPKGIALSNRAEVFLKGDYFIELGDFNSGGGVPEGAVAVNTMPYRGGAFGGLGAVRGVDNDGDGTPSSVDSYRLGIQGTSFVPGGDLDRGDYEVSASYKVGWAGAGNWYNYTRTFPPGDYNASMAVGFDIWDNGSDVPVAQLGQVDDPTVANQTVTPLGDFEDVTLSGFDFSEGGFFQRPAVGTDGNPITITSDGTPMTLRLTIPDGSSHGSWGTFLVLHPVNVYPVANNDSYTVTEDPDQSLIGDVLFNDTDLEDGKPPMVANPGVRQTPGGPVELAANGSFNFTPGVNFNGPITFTYETADSNGAKDTATVTITVTPVPDAPVATGQEVTTVEDTPLPIVLGGTDADGDVLSYAVSEPPAMGTLSGTPPQPDLHAERKLLRDGQFHLYGQRRPGGQPARHGRHYRHRCE